MQSSNVHLGGDGCHLEKCSVECQEVVYSLKKVRLGGNFIDL